MQMNHYSQSFMPLSFMNSDWKEISSDKTELWQKMKGKKPSRFQRREEGSHRGKQEAYIFTFF